MELKEASQADGIAEPSLHLFIIKQSFVPNLSNRIGFAWPESKTRRPRQANLVREYQER